MGGRKGTKLKKKNPSLADIYELITNKNSYRVLFGHRIHQLSHWLLSTVRVKNSSLLQEKRIVSQRASPRAVPEIRGWDSISQRAVSVSSPRNSFWS